MTIFLDRQFCEQARQSRDPRFDGKFFVAVISTGIYCRNVCRVKLPLAKNVVFYASAAAAQKKGFRPCLRCRPETVPGSFAWQGTGTSVGRAVRLWHQDPAQSVGQLCTRLGMGERHLHRLFLQHMGVNPMAVRQSIRLHQAKRLLDETNLPMSQVSQLSGYSSQRRFNDHLVSSYGCTPSQLRNKTKHHTTKVPSLSLQLHYRPPYDWNALLEFLSIRSIPGVEVIEAGEYRRSIRLGGQYCLLRVRQDKANHRLLCNITPAPESELLLVTEKLRNMFDLYADPIEIDKVLSLEPRLQQNLKRHPGLRIPGCWDGFETCIRAIVGQQISVTGAITIVGRIVARYGTACDLGAGVTHVFPSSKKLSKELELDHLAMPRARAQAIANVCHANASGAIDFEQMGVEELMKNLQNIKGIGPWTAAYVAVRAMHEPDIMPVQDLVLQKMLIPSERLTAKQLQTRAEAWRPWRAYATFHLWQLATDTI
jgi:AraC family transcriptional regulator of adaptative response / DNA-3-methyladenine glycosylase II